MKNLETTKRFTKKYYVNYIGAQSSSLFFIAALYLIEGIQFFNDQVFGYSEVLSVASSFGKISYRYFKIIDDCDFVPWQEIITSNYWDLSLKLYSLSTI